MRYDPQNIDRLHKHSKGKCKMNDFLVEDIERVITTVPDNETSIELSSVIFCLGRDAENEEEYDYAFSKLLELYKRDNETVKAWVIEAFSLLAVLKRDIKKLDRSIVEPLIRTAYSRSVGSDRAMIQDAIDDINQSLDWDL
jgi:hypothetical protein